MQLKYIVEKIRNTNFKCNVFGQENEGEILQIDLVTNKVLVKLKTKVQHTEREIVPAVFANNAEEYVFEDKKVFLTEVWLNIE